MAPAQFSILLPGRWSPLTSSRTPRTAALQLVGKSQNGVANNGLNTKSMQAQVVIKEEKPKGPNTCVHLILDVLLDVLWRAEDSLTDEKVYYNVRMPHAMLRVACYGDDSVSDLLARVAQIATEADQDRYHAAALRIQTSMGARVCASSKLADLDPQDELVLGWSLSEVVIAKCTYAPSSHKVRSSTDSTHSGSRASSISDELDFPDACSQTAGPSACFVDEPDLGPCVLLNDGLGESPSRVSSEKLVCTLTF